MQPIFSRISQLLATGTWQEYSCSSCNKILTERRALSGDRVVWLVPSILKLQPRLQFDSSGGILTHSLLPSLYHLKLRGERLDELAAMWYFTHTLTMSSSWNQRTTSCQEHFHGRCLRSFFHSFQNNSTLLQNCLENIVSKTLTRFPFLSFHGRSDGKGLTGREEREFWRHFQIPGVPSAPQCWPLTLEVYQHIH